MIVGAEGAYYIDSNGRKILDGLSGLWCSGLGHGRREIVEAVQKQVATLDYAPAFQFGHPASFALANKIKELTPAGLDYVFFCGSGSRGGGHVAQDRARVLAREGPGHEDAADRPREGLSRRQLRRHLGRRHRRQPQDVRRRRVEADHLPHTQLALYAKADAFTRGHAAARRASSRTS